MYRVYSGPQCWGRLDLGGSSASFREEKAQALIWGKAWRAEKAFRRKLGR